MLEHWGDILKDIKETSVSPTVLTIMKKDGKVLLDQDLPTEYDGYPMSYGNRGRIQLKLYEYAKSLGVEVALGAAVTEVFETAKTAGCFIGHERVEADIIIGADGVHSKIRYHVTGSSDRPRKSGFAVYRSWFPLERLADDPVTEYIAKSAAPLYKIWIEQDTHAILTTNPALKSATCFVTHKASGRNSRQIVATCLVYMIEADNGAVSRTNPTSKRTGTLKETSMTCWNACKAGMINFLTSSNTFPQRS